VRAGARAAFLLTSQRQSVRRPYANDHLTGGSRRVGMGLTPSRRILSDERVKSVFEKIKEIKEGGGFRDHR
jgi:hypothetical protein